MLGTYNIGFEEKEGVYGSIYDLSIDEDVPIRYYPSFESNIEECIDMDRFKIEKIKF